MIVAMDRHLPTTGAAVTACRAIAAAYTREIEVTHDIGADQTSRRTAVGVGVTNDPDGSLPHEAFIEFSGLPRIAVRLYPEDDALITVEGSNSPTFLVTMFPLLFAPCSTTWHTSRRVGSRPATAWSCPCPTETAHTRSASP
jgi:hypothetical protein